MPAPAGTPCPALRKRYAIPEVSRSGPNFSFTDSGGNEWTLSLRENGAPLQGLLTWRQGGAEEPLAEGFSLPGGKRPMARLSGEVQLRRVVPGASGAAAATPASVGAGKQAGNIIAIIGANVVGLGLLYGANKLGKGSSETGSVTCSPRVCVVGTPGAPCFCESNVLSGALVRNHAGRRSDRRAVRRPLGALPGGAVLQQRRVRGPRRPVPVLKPQARAAGVLGAAPAGSRSWPCSPWSRSTSRACGGSGWRVRPCATRRAAASSRRWPPAPAPRAPAVRDPRRPRLRGRDAVDRASRRGERGRRALSRARRPRARCSCSCAATPRSCASASANPTAGRSSTSAAAAACRCCGSRRARPARRAPQSTRGVRGSSCACRRASPSRPRGRRHARERGRRWRPCSIPGEALPSLPGRRHCELRDASGALLGRSPPGRGRSPRTRPSAAERERRGLVGPGAAAARLPAGGAAALAEPVFARYRTTLALNLGVMALALLLGGFAVQQARRRAPARGARGGGGPRARAGAAAVPRRAAQHRGPARGRHRARAQQPARGDVELPRARARRARARRRRGRRRVTWRGSSRASTARPASCGRCWRTPTRRRPRCRPATSTTCCARPSSSCARGASSGTSSSCSSSTREPVVVRGSQVMLGQVAMNLVVNGCEAQAASGEVRVVSRREGDSAVVEFMDRGPGVAEADRRGSSSPSSRPRTRPG